MFCKNCGEQLSDDSIFCGNCGASTQQPMVNSGYQSNDASFKKNTHLIALCLAIIALISGILILFFQFDVTLCGVYENGKVKTESGPALELDARGVEPFLAGTLVFGIILIAAAIVGIIFFIKKNKGKGENSKGLFVMGLLGAIGAIIHMISILAVTIESRSVTISMNIPWFTWVLLILFAGVAVLDKVVFNKKN